MLGRRACTPTLLRAAACFAVSAAIAAVLATAAPPVGAADGIAIRDVSPEFAGGRVNNLAADPSDRDVFYAASEFGGLFKSVDGGSSWAHLDDHLPETTWDVAVDPSDPRKVYATSFYDGRVESLAGIEVSADGGASWARPASAMPPAAYACAAARKAEPSAMGIGIRPDAPRQVFVGTNCGVAVSTDSGATWSFVDPTPGDPTGNVWDVAVQSGGPSGNGIVDVCGDDGHHRSTDGGATWTGGSTQFPGGRCSIAASPDEPYVLFVVAVDNVVYESDDAGMTWRSLGNRGPQGRIPFVVTNQRSDDGPTNRFDLWYADISLFRAPCVTPAAPAPGGTPRCPGPDAWQPGRFAHADGGDLVFDSGTSVDACPRLYANDGGVEQNVDLGPNCHDPFWTAASNRGLSALWIWAMDGADHPGPGEDLYAGTQDNHTIFTRSADSDPTPWGRFLIGDGFDQLADPGWVVTGWIAPDFSTNLGLAGPGFVPRVTSLLTPFPPGRVKSFHFGSRLAQFGPTSVAVLTDAGVAITFDITASPIVWTQLPPLPNLATACNLRAAVRNGIPTFLVFDGCSVSGNDAYTYAGTSTTGSWRRIDDTDGLVGGLDIVAVDPSNPDRLYASNIRQDGPQMVFSTDGGAHWQNDPELDLLMTGGGAFKYRTSSGKETFAYLDGVGYQQPTLLAYDPRDGNVIVAGAHDAGVFLTTDGGGSWRLLTDPFDPAASGIPHITRPRAAYFDHEPAGRLNIYVSTQGRGIWRISVALPGSGAQPAALALSPKEAANHAGETHALTATVTDASGATVRGVTVQFAVAGAAGPSGGSAVTDERGEARFEYTRTILGSPAASDAISAFADTDGNGVRDDDEPADTAAKTWTAGPAVRITLVPGTATNVLGSTHAVTATAADAFGNPVGDACVVFSISGPNGPIAPKCLETGEGNATFSYIGAAQGTDRIHAFVDAGPSFNLVQDPGELFADATKTWVKGLDRFMCYDVDPETPFERRAVALLDQFASRDALVIEARLVCNAARLFGSELQQPDASLVCYALRDSSGERFGRDGRRVIVENEFGADAMTVHRPYRLCAPAAATRHGETPGDPSEFLDHFECYEVGGEKVRLPVTLADELLTTDVEVGRPVALCNPVEKDGADVLQPEAHLVCYKVKPETSLSHVLVDARDQFGVRSLRLEELEFLCVPSRKRAVTGLLDVEPSLVDFGTKQPPAERRRTVQITNTSSASVRLRFLGVSVPDSVFFPEGSTCMFEAPLAAGESCTFVVGFFFEAGFAGTTQRASFIFTASDPATDELLDSELVEAKGKVRKGS